jgi:hypothetical protein
MTEKDLEFGAVCIILGVFAIFFYLICHVLGIA